MRKCARRRRTKIRLFVSSFRGAHSRLTRTITQQKIRALVSYHRDRDRQKRKGVARNRPPPDQIPVASLVGPLRLVGIVPPDRKNISRQKC